MFYNFDNFWQLMTIFTIQTIAFAIKTIEKTILETCDIWDTDYNSDDWEPEFMTIFVTWQLIVTLDSIRNYCDVLFSVFKFWGNSVCFLNRQYTDFGWWMFFLWFRAMGRVVTTCDKGIKSQFLWIFFLFCSFTLL